MACVYGEALLMFVGQKDKVVKKEISLTPGGQGELNVSMKYFKDLLFAVTQQVRATVDRVRDDPKYNRMDTVPKYVKPGVT